MSNFQFLNKEWPEIFEIAKEAEDMANELKEEDMPMV
jgi:hypothetical protein